MKCGGRLPSVALVFLAALPRPAAAADCNANGADDALDIAPVNRASPQVVDSDAVAAVPMPHDILRHDRQIGSPA